MSHVKEMLSIPGSRLLFGGELLSSRFQHSIPQCYGSFLPTAVQVRLLSSLQFLGYLLLYKWKILSILIYKCTRKFSSFFLYFNLIIRLLFILNKYICLLSKVPLVEFIKPEVFKLCTTEIFGPFQVCE